MKMYILVKEDVPVDIALVSVAHAALATYLKYKDDEDVKEWINSIFYKVICRVNEKEFEHSKKYNDYVIIKESKLNNKEVAIGFKPRELWPKRFKYYKLYN
jgi:peptidyl-tRNA hydrolase